MKFQRNIGLAIVPSFGRVIIYKVLYVFPTAVFVCIAFLVFMDVEAKKRCCQFWTETVKIGCSESTASHWVKRSSLGKSLFRSAADGHDCIRAAATSTRHEMRMSHHYLR